MNTTLKEKIRAGKPICGTHVQLAEPAICEIYSKLGYDYIWLDTEHSYLSFKDVLHCLNACRVGGTPVVVRVPKDDLTAAKKILEMGPEGILFPMVNTAKEAERVIGYTLYPPHGTRGCGPMSAIGYGIDDIVSYIKQDHLDMCRFVQIESTLAINELEKMVKIPFIDGFVFGPCDLSNTVGDHMNVFTGKTHEWLKKAIRILKDNHKYIGISHGSASVETISHWHDMGIDMISSGSDFTYLLECAKSTLQNLKKAHIER